MGYVGRMSGKEIDYQAAEALLRAKRAAIIPTGASLDRKFFAWCARQDFGIAEIMSLFQHSGKAGKMSYECEILCPKCGIWRRQRCAKSLVRELVAAVRREPSAFGSWELTCEGCKEAERRSRPKTDCEEARRQAAAEAQARELERARRMTPRFAEVFLDPRRGWPPETPVENRLPLMRRECFDSGLLAEAVEAMPKEDFLRTPYWKAIYGEAELRAGGKCTLCAAFCPLEFCLRMPLRPGYEHTEESLRQMLFLCGSCRGKRVANRQFLN